MIKKEKVGLLRIVRSPWTGWSKDQPKGEVSEVEPKEGEKIKLKGAMGKFYFLEIDEVSPESLHLKVNGLSLKKGAALNKSGIDLRGCGMQDFILDKGEKAELNTCSMDVGARWTLEYV